MTLTKRQKRILAAMRGLGETATTSAIASRASLSVIRTLESLNDMPNNVESTQGKGGDTTWKIKRA